MSNLVGWISVIIILLFLLLYYMGWLVQRQATVEDIVLALVVTMAYVNMTRIAILDEVQKIGARRE